MLEVRINVPENQNYGGIVAAYKKGEFVYISGTWTPAQVADLNMGQAEAGHERLTRCTGGALNIPGMVFPIDKHVYTEADSDSDYNTLTAGDLVIRYGPGNRLATDCYQSDISGGTALGTKLYVNTTGWLSLSGHAAGEGSPIAVLVSTETVGTTNYFNGTPLYSKDLIVYDLL